MSSPAFLANLGVLITVAVWLAWIVASLLWRVGSWYVSSAASLIEDEGLRIGSTAPQVAARRGDDEFHLSFGGRPTFVVFGAMFCSPCHDLLEVARHHPATQRLRRVFLSDDQLDRGDPIFDSWEVYEMDDPRACRTLWRAPVSPYFYLVGADNSILAKGLASKADHLDRLISIGPHTLPANTIRRL